MIAGRKTRWLRYALLPLVAVIWVVPYLWMALTSLKTLPEILSAPTAVMPKSFELAAYGEVFSSVPIARYLATTAVMACAIAFLQVLLALPAGYALAKLDFRAKGAAFGLVVACLLVPAQVTFVPVFLLSAKLGLVNTMSGLVLPFAASAFGTFLVRQALVSVPDALIEAARLDGAGELRIIYGLLAPMIRPTLTALFLLSFVFHYNDYFWPLVMTTDERVRTIPLAIALLREQGTGVRWHIVMAGNVILSAPVLLLFALTERHLLRAITARS